MKFISFYVFVFAFCISTIHIGAQINPTAGFVFDDSSVPRIDITINPDTLDWILDNENLSSNILYSANFSFDNGEEFEVLENVGFRLRGNTSRNADKKSFKIDFNHFESGRKFYGLEKMNLNGQHNDPTISRAKICSDIGTALDIPMMRTNHVRLYINEEFRGVYLNVEHIDEEFAGKRFGNESGQLYKCLYPADLQYKGSSPSAYKEVIFGRRAYDLKNKTIAQDYSDLAEFITILNNSSSSEFVCELEQVFNLDNYLKCIVFDLLTGNWDGPIYNKNNFYLYHNDSTDLFEYIPFDLDNTLGIDWLNKNWSDRDIYDWSHPSEDRPLYKRILENQELRDRFSYYMSDALENVFSTELWERTDELHDLIKEFVEIDTYYSQDYGFDIDDFDMSFEFGSLSAPQIDFNLKEYIEYRAEFAQQQLENFNTKPILTNLTENFAFYSDSLHFTVAAMDDNGIDNVQLCYSLENTTEICIEMLDDGQGGDQIPGDGIYSWKLAPTYERTVVNFRFEAADITGKSSQHPTCDYYEILVDEELSSIVINELMAKNDNIISDEYGERNDWIEIFNLSTTRVSLNNKYLSDDATDPLKWKLPNVTMEPGEYLIIWADDEQEQGKFHTNFKLDADGGFLRLVSLVDNEIKVLNQLDFPAQESNISWARIPNGVGDFQADGPTPRENNQIVSTDTSAQEMEWTIHPNPSTNYIQIDTKYESLYQLELRSVDGKVVFLQDLVPYAVIDIAHLPAGIYIASLWNESKHIDSKKIVKL